MTSAVLASALQIKAKGGLDQYISKQPEASIFKYNYKRITDFAVRPEILQFNERVDFGKLLTVDIPFVGDLVHKMNLYFKLPLLLPAEGSSYAGWTNTIGYAMIEYVEVLIGNMVIDRHTGLFMEVMDYLSTPIDITQSKGKMVGRYDTTKVLPQNALGPQDIYVPLQFWFTKKAAAALPLLCLTHHTVQLRVKLREFEECVTYDGPIAPTQMSIMQSGLIADYILLDAQDKSEYTKGEISYIIEQWQSVMHDVRPNASTQSFDLDFRFAVKEIIWVLVDQQSLKNNDYFNYGSRNLSKLGSELFTHASILFDGKERCSKMPESYFRLVQPSQYHTRAGDRNIYVYSFSVSPELNQPSGTANFSRFDRTNLVLEFVDNVPASRLYTMAVSYNRLIIANGMAQVEFAQ